MSEDPKTADSPDAKEMQDERSVRRPREEPRSGNPHVGKTRAEGRQRNEHWEGVIHYQDSGQPQSLDRQGSNWEGVQQTKTTAVDLEGERLATKVQGGSLEQTHGVERTQEHSLSR